MTKPILVLGALAIAFTTAPLRAQGGPLQVLRHTPGDTASPDNIVTVTFDRPVAGRLDATVDANRIFRIEPAVSGTVAWRDPITIRFIPDEPLPPGSRFTVTIDNRFSAIDGSKLTRPYRFSFRVPGPRLLGRNFDGGDGRHPGVLPIDGRIQLLYSAPVDLGTLARGLRLELAQCHSAPITIALRPVRQRMLENSDPYGFRYAGGWNRDTIADRFRRVVEVEAARPVPNECAGQIVIPNTSDDSSYGAEERFAIVTAPLFRLKPLECARLATCSPVDVTLEFTTPVTAAAVERYVHLEPPAPILLPQGVEQGTRFPLKLHLAPRSTYTVMVDTAIEDIYGRKLEPPYRTQIVIGDYAASIGYPRGIITMPRSDLTIPVRHLNVSEARIISIAIPDSERPHILALSNDLLQVELGRTRLRADTTLVTLPGVHNVEDTTQLVLPPAITSHGLVVFRIETALRITGSTPDSVQVVRGEPAVWTWTQSPYAILQLTDLAVHAKIAPGQGVVLVTGLRDGEPRGGATVRQLDDSGRVVAVGTTGPDGIAVFRLPARATATAARTPISSDWPPRVGVIEASLGDDRVILPLARRAFGYQAMNPLQTWQLGARPGVAPIAAAALFADRGIYRPGEMLYLHGIVRFGWLGALELPRAGDSVRATVTYRPNDWTSNEDVLIRDTVIRASRFGTVTDSFRLRPGVALGSYVAELHVWNEGAWRVIATEGVRVAEYRAPEFLVDVVADSGVHRAGDTLHVRVKSSYLFGAPMAGATLAWSAILHEARPWELRIPGADGWSVGAWDDVDPSQSAGSTRWVSGQDTTNAAGERMLSIPLSGLRPSMPGRVAVDVAVTDVNRQVVTASTDVAVHGTDLYVLARRRSAAPFWTAGQRVAIELRTVRPDGSPVTGVPVVIFVVRRVWKPWQATGYEGRWVDDSLRTDTVRSADGPTPYGFVPAAAGWYLLRLTATDDRGTATHTTVGAYVLGGGATWYTASPFHLPLVADRGELEVGAQAHVAFDCPFDTAEAWITVEREGVIEQRHETVRRGSNVLTFGVTDRYLPNVFVGVLLVRARAAGLPRPDSAAQVMRVGYAELRVKTSTKRLAVTVAPRDGDLGPGDSSVVHVRVRDDEGRGVSSEVTLWAVDEGVLALTGYSTPDVLARMYEPRGLAVGVWSTLPTILTTDPGLVIQLMRQLGLALSQVFTTGVGAEANAGNAAVNIATGPRADALRSRFRSTAFFVGSVTTDTAGNATIRARVPDNLTTYRVMAVAVSAGDRFGSGESKLLVTRPLVARSTLPRFVRPGDSLVAGAAVNVRDGQPRRATVEAASEGIRLQGESRRTVALERGRGGEARFAFRAPPRDSAPDTVSIRLRAFDGTDADGLEVKLPVKPDFHPRTHVAMGLVRDSTSVVIPLPGDIDATRSRLWLRIGTSPLPAMLAAYDWIRVYPYDCTEQIASGGDILLAVWRATRDRDAKALGGDPRPRLQALVEELERRQRGDGAIRYWFDYEWSSPWLSAYAGSFLLDARDAGIAVDRAVLVRLGDYLAKEAAAPIDTGGANRFERRYRRLALGGRVAVVEYLRRAGMPNEHAEDELSRLAFLMTWEDRLRLAEVLGRRANTRAEAMALVDAAWRTVTPAGRRLDLPDSVHADREFPSRVAPISRLLTATLALRPDEPLLGGLIESVLQLGRAEGGWAWSTQDYAAMVLAMSALPQDEDRGERIVVSAGTRAMVAQRAGDADSTSAVPLTGLLERAAHGQWQLRLRLAREGSAGRGAYFAVSVDEVPSKPPVTPDIKGIVVERWYERFDDGRPVTAVQAGDLLRVRLRVTVPADRAFVAVEDPLPAGLEVVDLSLRTSGTLAPFVTPESDRARRAADRNRDGPLWQSWLYGRWDDGWWSPWEHEAIHDDKVVYFARMLWTGSYTASYVARATTSGTFVRPPAHAQEMYNPGVSGRSDGGQFDILEAKP